MYYQIWHQMIFYIVSHIKLVCYYIWEKTIKENSFVPQRCSVLIKWHQHDDVGLYHVFLGYIQPKRIVF